MSGAFRFSVNRHAWFVLLVYGVLCLGMAATYPLNSTLDELQHYSIIKEQAEDMQVFPAYENYRILNDNGIGWSEVGNYINHPSPYYIAMGLFDGKGGRNLLLLRVVNVALSFAALAILFKAVDGYGFPPRLCAALYVILACFPKNLVVGGLINNDNMAFLAAALVFLGVSDYRKHARWLMLGILLAGWAKLTAFLALSVMVIAWFLLSWREEGKIRIGRKEILVILAAMAGAVPYAANYLHYGSFLWTNDTYWFLSEQERLPFEMGQFAVYFFQAMVFKWPAIEGTWPYGLVLAGLCVMAFYCVAGIIAGGPGERKIICATLVALGCLLIAHLGYGWESFVKDGNLTTPQFRYYNVLWPGVALSMAIGGYSAAERWRMGKQPLDFLVMLMLLFSLPGGLLLLAVQT